MTTSSAPLERDRIHQVVRDHLPASWRDRELPDATPLGADGVGLDSIAILELLLACERETGRPFPAALLGDGRLTIGRLVAFASQAGA